VGFFEKFMVLKGAIRELWLVFAIKLLAVAAYAVTNSTVKLWLSSDLGYADRPALAWVTTWSVLMTLVTLLVGSLTDALGLRKTFFLGVWVCIIARAVMVCTTIKWLVLGCGLLPLALGEALGNPVIVASVRRYSNTSQRSISFSIAYMMMNVGFFVAGYAYDWVRQGLGEHGHWNLFGWQISTYRTLFLVSLTIEISLLPILYFLRKGAEATDEGLRIVNEPVKYPTASLWNSFWLTVRDSLTDTVQLFAGLLRQTAFYRLLAFLVLIGLLKLIMVQMYYIYPDFGIRELGDGAPIGHLWAINSVLIVVLVPVIGALTQKLPAYRMVIIGGIISASSVFIMAMPTGWFEPLSNSFLGGWLGHGYLGLTGSMHPYYVMIAIYVVLLSIGEAFYSPRVYEYAAAIAPEGREASYGALSYVPLFLAKLMVGPFLGVLLARYCPEHGVRHSATMWLILGLVTTMAPVGLLMFRRYIRVHEAGRED
jgi:MFS family permease